MNCLTPVAAVEPHNRHEISVVFSVAPAGMAPGTLNPARCRDV